MFNRFSIHNPATRIVARFKRVQLLFNPPVNDNIAPTTTVPVVPQENGRRVLDGCRWCGRAAPQEH